SPFLEGVDMDLGIRGRTALVCAASKGLGRACAFSLAREGVKLVITARGSEALEATAREIRAACKVEVTTAAGDITTDEGRRAGRSGCRTARARDSPASSPGSRARR